MRVCVFIQALMCLFQDLCVCSFFIWVCASCKVECCCLWMGVFISRRNFVSVFVGVFAHGCVVVCEREWERDRERENERKRERERQRAIETPHKNKCKCLQSAFSQQSKRWKWTLTAWCCRCNAAKNKWKNINLFSFHSEIIKFKLWAEKPKDIQTVKVPLELFFAEKGHFAYFWNQTFSVLLKFWTSRGPGSSASKASFRVLWSRSNSTGAGLNPGRGLRW